MIEATELIPTCLVPSLQQQRSRKRLQQLELEIYDKA